MKKTLISTSILLALTMGAAGMANAATEAEKKAAIDAGLAYLAASQNAANGYIGTGTTEYLISQTGAALLAFLEEKPNWGTNAAAYQIVVDKGINYLLANASVVPISPTGSNNPDSDGNNVGVKLYPGVTFSHDTYVTGLALPAIAKSGTPDALVTVGPLVGRTDGSGAGGAWTYKDVVQNTVDYFAYGQNPDGGWRYYANYGASDQSTAQWPVIGNLFAQEMGVSTQPFVNTELVKWVNAIQQVDGSGQYMVGNDNYGDMNETGALLIMQNTVGWDKSDPKVAAALAYINTHWQELAGFNGNVFDGNFAHPYAMWAIYKGLESTIGLDDTITITNLHADPGDVELAHGWNWWEDYCESLVNAQLGGGNWNGYSSYWNSYLATAWNINILAATEIPDNKIPEPGTLLLFGTGMIGLARVARRRKG